MDIHKRLVPILYTLLWGTSIYACTWDWGASFQDLPIDAKLIEGAFSIYIAFMIECIINLFDFAHEHKTEQFNINFIYWLIKFAGSIIVTIILTILLFKYKDYANYIGFFIILSMCWLKYINVFFTNNVKDYMIPLRLNTYVSTLKNA